MLPAVFFFLKIVLPIQGLLWFHIKFNIVVLFLKFKKMLTTWKKSYDQTQFSSVQSLSRV